jgi:hypothetical protein
MAFPQLLVGKVAAITGGLTGIGRVGPSMSSSPEATDKITGNCPRLYPSWSQGVH